VIDLSTFRGDSLELKWNRKDLESLELVLKIVPEKNVVVQAGGCLGVFPKYLAEHFSVVYAFEPSAQFVDMTRNATERNIVRFQAALGDARGMVEPVCSLRGNDGKSVLHAGMTRVEAGRGFVPTLRIDDLALAVCDLIYLDVEGYELYALRGAAETIERCRPVIVCEVNRGIEYLGIAQEELRKYVRSLGYTFYAKYRSDEVYVPCT
jgi:FkbM family methyltransferase